MTTFAALATIAAASAANASLPPNGGLGDQLLSEKEYLDQLAPNQLSNLIDILNDSAADKAE
jgi:hypothetical protein